MRLVSVGGTYGMLGVSSFMAMATNVAIRKLCGRSVCMAKKARFSRRPYSGMMREDTQTIETGVIAGEGHSILPYCANDSSSSEYSARKRTRSPEIMVAGLDAVAGRNWIWALPEGRMLSLAGRNRTAVRATVAIGENFSLNFRSGARLCESRPSL